MGISRSTALEIVSNPNDLEISISRKNEGDLYSFTLTRGPGHNFKYLLSTTAVFETVENAIEGVVKILEYCIQDMKLMDSAETPTLTKERLRLIEAELKSHQIASTYKTAPV